MKIIRVVDGKEVSIELTFAEKNDLRHEWFRDQILYGIEDLRANEEFADEETTPEEYDALDADADELADEFEERCIRKYFDSGVFDRDVSDFLLDELEDRRV